MEWRDEGVLLSLRKHGETAAIIEVFTERHGRHAGVVRGAMSRRLAPLLQPGAQLALEWRARLEDHLGSYRVEPVKSRAGAVLGDRRALAGLSAVCALLDFTLPEREPHPDLYRRSVALLDALGAGRDWPLDYLRWEMRLLEEMGFGLDLSCCAVTGATEGLAYVSPRTGRAVSRAGAGEWQERLLPLPPELAGGGSGSRQNLLAGFALTGHFLESWLAPALGDRPLPGARGRLVDRLARDPPGGNR
ncbi:DNA repair protein RecO [Maritimibacter sp. 55A14]|uniref:DNA repair protein RecO n=1 Tax=Maritimibacter sp. 55A14 TaxID=2174844 RepID=UPI000D6130FB|nr:DNA repair protein RecO [Maritimibacter sp. 55A14]PWE32498.1 DNA repair protein RecO [Maritimibacter sp. 55A14]